MSTAQTIPDPALRRLVLLSVFIVLLGAPRLGAQHDGQALARMEEQPLEFGVASVEEAMARARLWLEETGHLPTPYGVRNTRHLHSGPRIDGDRLVASCRLTGSKAPRAAGIETPPAPGWAREGIAPGTMADTRATEVEFRWRFEVEVHHDGDLLRIVPGERTPPEMARILARFIQTGSAACRGRLEWLIDRAHDPVAFDPRAHRLDPPTVDDRDCFSE